MAEKSALGSTHRAAAPPAGYQQNKDDGKLVNEAELKAAYRKFNDRMKLFISDLVKVYGREYPGIVTLQQQIEVFTKIDPARMILANKAWQMFDRARTLIDKRDETVFTQHDIAGLKARAKVDPRVVWSKASAKSKEAMWRAMEDLLDRLDEINDIKHIPVTLDDLDDFDEPPNPSGGQKKSSSLDEGEKKKKKKKKSRELAQEMMGTLKKMVGGEEADSSINNDFEEVMKKLGDPSAGEPTEKDQEVMTRLLTNFVNRLAPGGENDAELDKLPEKDRQAEKARRTIEAIQKRIRIKHAIGKLTMIESLQKTTDPTILQMDAKEAAAEKERMENPEKNKDYSIRAHFNYKMCLLLQKLHLVRGNVKSKKDGHIMFPSIKSSFAALLRIFKENPGSQVIVEPIGEWIAQNRKKLNRRDDSVFLNATHPFLVEFKAADVWSTFRPDEREAFWDLVGHPIQLATIHHDLYTGELQDIASIVDDLLASSGVAYDSDPREIDGQKMIFESIEKGCTPEKLKRIHGLFNRMQNDPDQKTMKSISKLMQHVLPQALRSRGLDASDEGDDSSDDDDVENDEKEPKDKKEDDGKLEQHIQSRFAQMLASVSSQEK